jgi:hypothetical protein
VIPAMPETTHVSSCHLDVALCSNMAAAAAALLLQVQPPDVWQQLRERCMEDDLVGEVALDHHAAQGQQQQQQEY